jgi:KipI family sensor histidine kinase inhibitor
VTMRPFGERAFLIEVATLDAVLAVHDRLAASAPPGVTELVPAARTVLVRLDRGVDAAGARAWAERAAAGVDAVPAVAGVDAVPAWATVRGPVDLPIVYDGPDLAETAALLGLTVEELIARHTSARWIVAFTGFAPGFGYLVSPDWPFDIPRLDSPRTRVPVGAVGLAGEFTGAYPRETPGGWRLIGTTTARLFDADAETPVLLEPGIRVRLRRARPASRAERAAAGPAGAGRAGSGRAGSGRAGSGRAGSGPAGAGPAGAGRAGSGRAGAGAAGAGPAGAGPAGPDTAGLEPAGPRRAGAGAAGPDTAGLEPAGPGPAGAGAAGPGRAGAGPAGAEPARPEPAGAGLAGPETAEPESAALATAALRIVEPGLLATVQDLGRPGLAHLGIATSGALDRRALRAANRLVGNAESAAGIEITLGGFRAIAVRDLWCALGGAWGRVRIDGREIDPCTAQPWPVGAELEVDWFARGARGYLAVRGGIDAPVFAGSRSTDVLAGIGPVPLRAGDLLGTTDAATSAIPTAEPAGWDAPHDDVLVLEVAPGPRGDWFAASSLALLFDAVWTVTARADRVGVRLDGPPLERVVSGELPSEGMVPGAIQVPPSGGPTILLADGPVTGGYPVIAVLTDAALDLVAQARAGTVIRFRHARAHG